MKYAEPWLACRLKNTPPRSTDPPRRFSAIEPHSGLTANIEEMEVATPITICATWTPGGSPYGIERTSRTRPCSAPKPPVKGLYGTGRGTECRVTSRPHLGGPRRRGRYCGR